MMTHIRIIHTHRLCYFAVTLNSLNQRGSSTDLWVTTPPVYYQLSFNTSLKTSLRIFFTFLIFPWQKKGGEKVNVLLTSVVCVSKAWYFSVTYRAPLFLIVVKTYKLLIWVIILHRFITISNWPLSVLSHCHFRHKLAFMEKYYRCILLQKYKLVLKAQLTTSSEIFFSMSLPQDNFNSNLEFYFNHFRVDALFFKQRG